MQLGVFHAPCPEKKLKKQALIRKLHTPRVTRKFTLNKYFKVFRKRMRKKDDNRGSSLTGMQMTSMRY